MKYQHCVLLPIALFLIVAGIVSLLLLGVGNLEPYAHTKDFRLATCTVVYTNLSGEVPCTRFDEEERTKIVHHSWYPCVAVLVNYTELVTDYNVRLEDDNKNADLLDINVTKSSIYKNQDELVAAVNVMLYDTYQSWSMRHTGQANSTVIIIIIISLIILYI